MKFCIILSTSLLALSSVYATVDPGDILRNQGPLYHSIRFLIFDENQNAQLFWNKTQREFADILEMFQEAVDYLQKCKQIMNEKLDQIIALDDFDKVKRCCKKYERQIARFNRDLFETYLSCKQSLKTHIYQLKCDFMQQIKYIRKASIKIQQLNYICNVTDLKGADRERHHATVLLCILSNLGEIKQSIYEAAQVGLNVLSRTNVGTKDMGDHDNDIMEKEAEPSVHICLEFQYLKNEINTIFEVVMLCVDEVE